MKRTNTNAPAKQQPGANPYSSYEEHQPNNPLVRAGMSVAETVVWLVIMAVLSICMIVMLWHVSK